VIGKKVAEKRNIGCKASWMMSRSCHWRMKVVTAEPRAANAIPTSRAAGIARIAHGEATRPSASITTRNPTE